MFFQRKETKLPQTEQKRETPDNLWIKCENCSEILYRKHIEKNYWICPNCNYHFRINSDLYLNYILDGGGFIEEYVYNLETKDFLNFPGYAEKLKELKEKTKLNDASRVGYGKIDNFDVIFFITDFRFLAGSMGAVLGEKFFYGVLKSIEKKIPYIALTSSGGGARMHEGIISLMQMAKTTLAVIELRKNSILYINILTDPTMGGVMASFAALGDILIAEPGALLGFAGPRVIEQTIKEKLPEGFQRSEFLLKKGQVDLVVPRNELKTTISKILRLLS
ncbi:MAG: acetyl-CoA carboxylase, carboxyltransferase subunit beta [candidate division WOR-3 bacterium]|nr:acetyl-CoA carboxylase, carboxyltransferase subunit beta [candidate division WOR-3 bacterium]MDW8150838.1 acetyl-CoA carboxylase, carboxyltransferase subunit beta [candidate division WOR-3 bacterium]